MSPIEHAKRIVTQPSTTELITHATVVLTVVLSATLLGINKDLNSGDLLAVYTASITGTAAVAGARSGNRRTRTTDNGDDA